MFARSFSNKALHHGSAFAKAINAAYSAVAHPESITNSQTATFMYSEEHLAIQQSLGKLIEKEINPYVDEWEAQSDFPSHKVLKLLGSKGFLGADKSTEYGGLGLDFTYTIAIAEQLGSIRCGGVPLSIGASCELPTAVLNRHGSSELKKEFMLPTLKGDVVACLGVSEPDAGSDVASTRTTAKEDGDDYVINGSKSWITNGYHADWACLLVNTKPSTSLHQSKSLICVPLNVPGVSRSRIPDKLGMRCSDTGLLHFDNVRVPKRNRIGEDGRGFVYQMWQFQEERLLLTASSLQPMERVIQETVEYCKQRTLFGKPLLDNQVVHYRLAELQTEVMALRTLLFRALAEYVGQGKDVTLLASMAKLKAGRLVREVMDSCLQFFGGMGFMDATLASRLYRDLRLFSIGGGADEVMLSIIAKYMTNTRSSRTQ